MTRLYVTEDWTRLVPEGHPEARFGVQPKDLRRLGLDHLAPEAAAAVEQPEPQTIASADPGQAAPDTPDEPEEKEQPKPQDKAARRPATK